MSTNHRLPISSRHAFALAFDLAFRRDPLQSIVVPLLLQAAWAIAFGLAPTHAETRSEVFAYGLIHNLAVLGFWFTGLLVSAMLRFRARSVFNASPERHPTPALECYREGLRRVAALGVTEVVRVVALVVGAFLLFFPGLYVGFKFSMATETVVLTGDRPGWRRELVAGSLVLLIPVLTVFAIQFAAEAVQPFGWVILGVLEVAAIAARWPVLVGLLLRKGAVPAFRRSFHLTEGRWERWLEMIVISVMLVLPIWFVIAAGSLLLGHTNVWFALGTWLTTASLSIVQYAWTFFYLRLDESESARLAGAAVHDPVPTASLRHGAAPQLRLVELDRDADEEPNRP